MWLRICTLVSLLVSPTVTLVSRGVHARHDIVITGGTVIDPETNTHAQLNVAIAGDRVVELSAEPMSARRELDATGLYVTPGFIDLASYGPYHYASRFKVADGVTTALSLHGGTADFPAWEKRQARARPMVNYGSAVSHQFLRRVVGVGRYRAASQSQLRRMVRRARRSIDAGALGVSFSLEYTPGASRAEVGALMKVAAERGVLTFFHLRYSDPVPPGTNAEAVDEVITLARQSGARVHIHHLTSTGATFTLDDTVAQIEAARASGVEITADIYPYSYWATYLRSARFDPGWQERFQIGYDDLQLTGTERRLDAPSFKRLRQSKRVVVAYAIPEEEVTGALRVPWIMIGSDSVISRSGGSHPRGAGCFARLLGRYVREQQVLDIDEAIRRMTLLPAMVLEIFAPAMKNKGRLQAGMDADVVVVDLASVRDTATVAEPRQFSHGIHYVLVNGQIVRDGHRILHRSAGKLIRSEASDPPAATARR